MTPDPVFIASEGDSADHVWLIAILRTYNVACRCKTVPVIEVPA